MFIVNLHIRTFHSWLVCGCFYTLYKIFHQSREDSSRFSVNIFDNILQNTKYRISFTWTSLTICKNTTVVTLFWIIWLPQESEQQLSDQYFERVHIVTYFHLQLRQIQRFLFYWVLKPQVHLNFPKLSKHIVGTYSQDFKAWDEWQLAPVLIYLFYCLTSFN